MAGYCQELDKEFIMAMFERVANYPELARSLHSTCVWNNRIIMACGIRGSTRFQDVWESVDGVHWNQLNATAVQPARDSATLTVCNNRLYLIGGWDGTNYLNDVWESLDGGTTWAEITTPTSSFGARDDHSAWCHDNRLVIAGGDAGGNPLQCQWSSWDGTSWVRTINNYTRIARTAAAFVHFNNRMFMICGYDGTNRLNTAISSDDAVTWDINGSTNGLPFVSSTAACVFDNKIVLTGGTKDRTGEGTDSDEVYFSTTGDNWTYGGSMGFTRYNHRMEALKNPNRMFLLFGYDGSASSGEIWMSYGHWQDNR